MNATSSLEQGLALLGASDSAESAPRLVQFLELVRKWNKIYNLTAILSDERMVVEHLLDSLSILALLRPPRVLDIGTGAGFPGIPIAIANPALRVTLLDSSHKRCAFLRQAAIDLALTNVDIACTRVEQFRPAEPYDTVVSRAFAETATFAAVAESLVHDSGILLAMKGAYPAEEIQRLPGSVRVLEVVALRVPGLDAQRHAVIMTKALR